MSEEWSTALDNIGSTTDSRLDFKRRLIVLQGPDVLNSTSKLFDFERFKE